MTLDYLIGTQLDEYRLESLLGRGGMARVYRGLDVNLNRIVAIKVIDIPHRAEVEYVRRFKREAQAIARLDHPHIVRLYRYGEVVTEPVGDRVLYMAMQYIQGATLETILAAYRREGTFLETPEAIRIIREVCEALDYAHANEIIHRDIKPANIMLDTHGRAILTDFGLALFSTQSTRGEIFGSPQYIAPEQAISSAKAVPQSDLYSIGVILYEMFTGILPFDAEEPLELALMQINNPAPSPRKIRPELSPELETVILRALEKRPEKRYPSGKALSVALDHALSRNGLSAPVPRVSLAQRIGLELSNRDLQATSPLPIHPGPGLAGGTPIQPTRIESPGKATPLQPAASTAATKLAKSTAGRPSASGQPGNRRANPLYWLLAGLGGLAVLAVLCLASNGWFFYSQILTRPTQSPTANGPPTTSQAPVNPIDPTLTPTPIEPTRTRTPTRPPTPTPTVAPPTQTPTAIQTPVPAFTLQIYRQSGDRAYLVLKNPGRKDLPLVGLSLHVDQDEVLASAWDIGNLNPGECLLAWNEDHKGNGLPEGIRCRYVGRTLVVKKSLGAVFNGKLEVWVGEQSVGVCDAKKDTCSVSFGP